MNNHPRNEFIHALHWSMAELNMAIHEGFIRSSDPCDPRFVKEQAHLNSLRHELEVLIDIEKERQSCET